MLIHNKDNIQFFTEFTCFMGHPVDMISARMPCADMSCLFISTRKGWLASG